MRRLVTPLVFVAFAIALRPVPLATAEKVQGYAEFRRPGVLIVDGQRITADSATVFKGKGIASLADIPLGYQVEVTGTRRADGVVRAQKVEAHANGTELFEKDVLQATDAVEAAWVQKGMMFEPREDGTAVNIGEISTSGPKVDRVRRIMDHLRPPYVGADRLRVRVVHTKEWNASAMGNGAIWVYDGLLDQMTDDEMSIVLGHELTHFTHEHSRRQAKRGLWTQLIGLSAVAAASSIDNKAAKTSALIGTMLAVTAFQSGYSRDLEDQADRVGLRYAYEGGYNVRTGPGLWEKFRRKYGESDRVSNFFAGSHSRPSDRIRNIQREIAINYN